MTKWNFPFSSSYLSTTDAQHGFTQWGSSAYQEMADSRSWWSMMSLFRDLITTSDNITMMGATDDEAMVVDGDDEAMMVDGNDSSASSSGKTLLHSISTVVAAAATLLL
jgi:hypothetical protein